MLNKFDLFLIENNKVKYEKTYNVENSKVVSISKDKIKFKDGEIATIKMLATCE